MYPMPKGLEKYDVYLIEEEQSQPKKSTESKEAVKRDNLDNF